MLIFLFQLLEPAQFKHAQAAALFLPVVLGGLDDTHLTAHLCDDHARVSLAQGEHDLGLGKFGLFYDTVYWFKVRQVPGLLYFAVA